MAEKSDCIIVGRCADYVLQDLNPFRLFVYADISSKIARCREKGADAAAMTDKELQQKLYLLIRKEHVTTNFIQNKIGAIKQTTIYVSTPPIQKSRNRCCHREVYRLAVLGMCQYVCISLSFFS